MIDMLPAAMPLDAAGINHTHIHGLYALIYSRVGNREAAERLTSAVVMTALQRLDATPAEHNTTAWLDRAARNAATDYWRGGQEWPRVSLEPEGLSQTHLPAVEVMCRAHARTLLGRLPETDRAVLSHRIVEGLSVAETAQRMGVGEAQVKVLQYQALRRAAHLRKGDVQATHAKDDGTKEGDDDASIQSRPLLCPVTPVRDAGEGSARSPGPPGATGQSRSAG